MKPLRLSEVPLVLLIGGSDLGKTGEITEKYHNSSSIPRKSEDIQKLICQYFKAEGHYLADDLSLSKFDNCLKFKRISNKKFQSFELFHPDFINMSLYAQIVLPKTCETLEGLVHLRRTQLKIHNASGLANLRGMNGQKIDYLDSEFVREEYTPNFMFPFSLQGDVHFTCAQIGKGLDFYNLHSISV